MIDVPPFHPAWIPVYVVIIGWLWRLTWIASEYKSVTDGRLASLEKDVANDITGRRGVTELRDRMTRVEIHTEQSAKDVAFIRAEIEKLTERR